MTNIWPTCPKVNLSLRICGVDSLLEWMDKTSHYISCTFSVSGVPVNLTCKIFDDWIKDLSIDLYLQLKTNWCLSLIINSTIIISGCHRLKLYNEKNKIRDYFMSSGWVIKKLGSPIMIFPHGLWRKKKIFLPFFKELNFHGVLLWVVLMSRWM